MNAMTLHARCERVTSETAGIKVFTLSAQGAHAEFLGSLEPGKHIALQYPDTSGIEQQRLYSITRKDASDLFEIAVKREGRGGVSDHLHATLQEGVTAPLQFVAGDISVASIIDHEQVGMLAGGIGITLPIALLRELVKRARNGQTVPKVTLLLCVPSIADIPFLHELLELDLSTSWFSLHVYVTREPVRNNGHFRAGRPTAQCLSLLGQPDAVVICGSHRFAQGFREHSLAMFPDSELLIESFTPPAAAQPAGPEHAQAGNSVRLHLHDSDQVLELPAGKSLLDMLESSGIAVRSLCRSGICGNCRIKVSDGECKFESDFCLSDQDKHEGYALACCTFPLSGNITVELNPTA
ncbi:2Fe-2S iron-sulfur cluster-binding protein [Pseudomonas oryzicola]|uniref:2Fe-2S iron-sulfur cluster binding domain-containing protein n=1 Tax=Pseudomonas oryzicola TaxID=485876 RepID=A0ABS6QGM2_9PSED|nr:2Fe-2S iron-sulfur cluster-binding protein [Pseudomonas oryzicola]MBV4493343.1 2Fe-2S iron-sulfur cluster binding domain-containing protein [Pseudomonas oryzicola]